MSLGLSIGDFLTVGILADKIYDRCKNCDTLKDLAGEVKSMHIVLNAIEQQWEHLRKDEQELSYDQRKDLEHLTDGCRDALKGLEETLDKYDKNEELEEISFIDRTRLITKDVSGIRNRLMWRTQMLASFNSAISEAKTLETLVRLRHESHNGRRRAPAFSQIRAPQQLQSATTWKSIETDLVGEGFEPSEVNANKRFIKDWIEKVIIDDSYTDDWDELDACMPESTVSGDDDRSDFTAPASEYESLAPSRLAPESPPSSRGSEFEADISELLEDFLLIKSSGIERRREVRRVCRMIFSRWEELDPVYARNTAITVEEKITKLLTGSSISVSKEALREALNSVGEPSSNRLYGPFTRVFIALDGSLTQLTNADFNAFVERICRQGEDSLSRWVSHIATEEESNLPLPWGWKPEKGPSGEWEFDRSLHAVIRSKTRPHSPIKSFAMISLVADKLRESMPSKIAAVMRCGIERFEVFDYVIQALDQSLLAMETLNLLKHRPRWPVSDSLLDEVYDMLCLLPAQDDVGGLEIKGAETLHSLCSKTRNDLESTLNYAYEIMTKVVGFMVEVGIWDPKGTDEMADMDPNRWNTSWPQRFARLLRSGDEQTPAPSFSDNIARFLPSGFLNLRVSTLRTKALGKVSTAVNFRNYLLADDLAVGEIEWWATKITGLPDWGKTVYEFNDHGRYTDRCHSKSPAKPKA
ncbi:hypothetical protein ABW19_dt0201904 [Dactylella cylindrospora]|nr:hypothetical protein ABW19_dt0201904 [Dactylella cylindrospora]